LSLFKNFFKVKDQPVKTYDQFWDWFKENQKFFHGVVKGKGDIQRFFLSKLAPKLKELRGEIFFLTGMYDKNTVELILTPDGILKNFYFAEELIAAAPSLDGWRFTALKPASDMHISMGGYEFKQDNMMFFAKEHPNLPDEIDLVIVHDDYDENKKGPITSGVYIFLDNYLGELNFATTIDNLTVTGKQDAVGELIPIEKLKDYLIWRQSEFIEKYEGVRHNTENDSYAMLKAEAENGNPVLVTVNSDLLKWDNKASHPWMLCVKIIYGGSTENNGMPANEVSDLMVVFEDEMMEHLEDTDGYLNLAHTTANGERDIYFACKEFRKPARVLDEVVLKYFDDLKIQYDIYKDKYWRSLERFAGA